jgi:cell wall-associated NlpC family hydrolase
MDFRRRLGVLIAAAAMAGCASPPRPSPRAAASPFERRGSPEVAPDPRVADMLVAAIALVGVPYRLGGNDMENGFDCSGFTRHLFQTHLGVTLPRQSRDQADADGFIDVPSYELQPGDLVFFNTLNRRNSHVGVYVGDGRFIHAPRTGAFVRLEAIGMRYWSARYDGARRWMVA